MKTLTRWIATLAGLLMAAVAAAAPPPAELFYKDADIVEAVLSPSGRQLAVTTARGAKRIGLAILDLGTGQATRAAQFSDGDVHEVYWVNDKRLLFSVVDLSDGSGRPNGQPGLFAVNPDGSEMRQLIRRQGVPVISDGSGRYDRLLDWNHHLLRVPTPRPGEANEEVLLYSLDADHVQTPLWVNVRTGRTRSVDAKAPPHTVGWLADSRGELRVAITFDDGHQAAFWRGPGETAWRKLYESGLFNTPFSPHSVDLAGNLYVLHTQGKEQQTVLSRFDFEHGVPERKPLVAVPGFNFQGQLLGGGSGTALGVRVTTDGEQTFWFHPALKALQQQADERLPGYINRISCRRCGEADMTALVRAYNDRDPGQLWVYQAQPPEGEKAWRPVGRVRNDIKPSDMAVMDFQRIKARDGQDLPVWVTRSPKLQGPLPAVVLVHGGPFVRGNVWGWHRDAQFLASRGYVVIEPEFRGSTGYGEAHFRAGFKQWGQAMQDDVTDALRWAQQQGLASDKACIAGASYGGYSTLMGLVKDPDLYRCGVAWLAVADLELLVKGSWWIQDDGNEARKYSLPDMVGDPVKDAAMLAANSPVKQAARIKAPLLLAYGEADVRVPIAHGKRMRDALKEAGNEPLWITYPGEGHGFGVVANRVDFAERMEAFLAQHLKP
ncbi:S9 family peptidase [Roseateles cellulosilyticus]|uniref:Prolyl oligopeptidase family serine peptidase n=1 Tax=Pelomonas cellulosilytica TaxID=2906762 RepID=A0ABS8XKX8_9BURK|nr:prolyl oligopeptidase family serine peptidase [Pelomonas sp. P8]MCE4553474.1 prolyl oligopeptidase family serine peptidase [Pelomonas sp. P8]